MTHVAASPSVLLPTSQRPVPFRMRNDLIIQRIYYQGTPSWVMKDPVTLKYHRLAGPQFYLLNQLNGHVTLAELRDRMQRHDPQTHWTLLMVQSLISDLHRKRLVVSDRPGQGQTLITDRRRERWEKFKQVAASFLFLKLPGVEPTPLLNLLYPLVFWIFRPMVLVPAGLFVAGSWLWIATYFDAFRQDLPEFSQFFAWPNLLYLWLTLAVIKVLHELGHALTCRHFGGECHEIGVMILVFSPTLYCDVTDSWMMPNKWHRIWIGAAGMCVEVFLSATALLVWWNTQSGMIHHLALDVFFVTTVTTAIFNANPLMRLDGYYMLADFLEIPNLRPKADKMLVDRFGQICLGIEPAPDPFDPEHGRGWFLLFALAAQIYRVVLMTVIGLFMYNVLKPYRLESIGVTIAAASILGMFGRTVWTVIRMIRTPRERSLSRLRIGLTLATVGGVMAAVCLVPVPIFLQAPFTIQPRHVRHVYNSLPGALVDVAVRAGDHVDAGDVIAQLVNEDKSDQLRELKHQLDVQKDRVKTYHALGSTTEKALAQQRVDTLTEQIEELQDELDQLIVRAPVAGTVIAPPPQPEPDLDSARDRLPRWSGSPLDPENLSMFVEPRTHLCSIAPGNHMEAVVLIDQLDRNQLDPGDSLRLKLDHLPHQTFTGTIRAISRRHQEFAPPQLSNKAGGMLPTVTDEQGRERLVSVAYEATVEVELTEELVQTGYRGRARKLLTHRPLGWWAYRWLRRTLYFRL